MYEVRGMNYGFIYIITNNINGKQYVGQTRDTVAMRWRKHLDNAKNFPCKQIITQAIARYGEENFEIKEVARCPIEDLNYWEIFYIKKYDTFQNGYNMTIGGNNNNTSYYSEQQLIDIINIASTEHTNKRKIAEAVGLSYKIVSKIMKKYDIKINDFDQGSLGNIDNIKPYWNIHDKNLVKRCPIKIVELDKEFVSMLECAQFLITNGYTKTDNEVNVMKSVSRATADNNYGRNTYLGFHIEKI